MVRLSLYTFLFTEDAHYYIYNSETNYFSEVGEGLFECLYDRDRIPKEIKGELLGKRILVEEEDYYNCFNETRLKFFARMFNPAVLNLVLAPTTDCNFSCPYCFEPKKNPKYMTDEVIEDVCDFMLNHKNAKELNLTWYGGEPLLAIKQIEALLARFATFENLRLTGHSLITNGFLLSENVLNLFKSYPLSSVQITLDGVKSRHNTTRCLKDLKTPTFDFIYDNILKAVNAWPHTHISIRVNIDRNTKDDYLKLRQQLLSDVGKAENISIYPGLIRQETKDACSLCFSSYTTRDIQTLYQYYKNAGADISSFPTKKGKGCMINGLNSYIVGPEGEIYKCWNDVSDPNKVVGNIRESEMANNSLFLRYMNDIMPFDDKCRNCKVFPICDGGCALHRYKNLFQ